MRAMRAPISCFTNKKIVVLERKEKAENAKKVGQLLGE